MTAYPDHTRIAQTLLDQQGEINDLKAALDTTYRERAHLVALLAALYPSHIGHTDPTAPDWAVLIIEAPGGQMSWHISPRDMDLFAHVQPTNRICRGWDGHTTDEKYQRIRDLTEAAPSLLGQDTLIEHQGRHIKQQAAELVAARAAIERVRRLCDLTIASSVRVQAVQQARDTLTALDQSGGEQPAKDRRRTDG